MQSSQISYVTQAMFPFHRCSKSIARKMKVQQLELEHFHNVSKYTRPIELLNEVSINKYRAASFTRRSSNLANRFYRKTLSGQRGVNDKNILVIDINEENFDSSRNQNCSCLFCPLVYFVRKIKYFENFTNYVSFYLHHFTVSIWLALKFFDIPIKRSFSLVKTLNTPSKPNVSQSEILSIRKNELKLNSYKKNSSSSALGLSLPYPNLIMLTLPYLTLPLLFLTVKKGEVICQMK